MNQISVLNNPLGVNMPLNEPMDLLFRLCHNNNTEIEWVMHQ